MMGSWGTPEEMTIKDDVPFMAEKEYQYIADLINQEEFKRVLEWGAGSSTIWFPKNTTCESWLAIEHNEKYLEYLKDKVDPKVELRLMQDKFDYIAIHGIYDLIIIDGLFRDECLEEAYAHLTAHPHSQIILHDSGRKEYHEWYDSHPHKIIFEGEGWLGDGWDHRGLTTFGNFEGKHE